MSWMHMMEMVVGNSEVVAGVESPLEKSLMFWGV
jgi:hypothetical protein